MLRKTIYPDQYGGMVENWPNGTINHYTLQAKHMGIEASFFAPTQADRVTLQIIVLTTCYNLLCVTQT